MRQVFKKVSVRQKIGVSTPSPPRHSARGQSVRVTGPAVGRKNPPCTGFVGAKLFAARLDEIWTFPSRYKKFDG